MELYDCESLPVDMKELLAENGIVTIPSVTNNSVSMLLKEYHKNPYQCMICFKRFDRNAQLIKHSRVHSGEKPFECKTCGKSFAQGGHLKTHMTIHTGEKPFGCDVCGKTFSTHTGRKRHGRTHTGERPYECQICHRAFIDKCHMKEHSSIHEKSRFKCPRCFKTFAEKLELTIHMKEHNEERLWMCGICDRTYCLRGSFSRHFVSVHKGMDPKLHEILLTVHQGKESELFGHKTETDEEIVPDWHEEAKLEKPKLQQEDDSSSENEEILPNI